MVCTRMAAFSFARRFKRAMKIATNWPHTDLKVCGQDGIFVSKLVGKKLHWAAANFGAIRKISWSSVTVLAAVL
jgi:hypothetical protein